MPETVDDLPAYARAHAVQLVEAVAAAEAVIVTTIERECEALRAGRMLAAEALHLRLCDAARLYLGAVKAVRSSLWTIERMVPGCAAYLEEGRIAFGAVLKVELAVLAAERRNLRRTPAAPAFARTAAFRDPQVPDRSHPPDDRPAALPLLSRPSRRARHAAGLRVAG